MKIVEFAKMDFEGEERRWFLIEVSDVSDIVALLEGELKDYMVRVFERVLSLRFGFLTGLPKDFDKNSFAYHDSLRRFIRNYADHLYVRLMVDEWNDFFDGILSTEVRWDLMKKEGKEEGKK